MESFQVGGGDVESRTKAQHREEPTSAYTV